MSVTRSSSKPRDPGHGCHASPAGPPRSRLSCFSGRLLRWRGAGGIAGAGPGARRHGTRMSSSDRCSPPELEAAVKRAATAQAKQDAGEENDRQGRERVAMLARRGVPILRGVRRSAVGRREGHVLEVHQTVWPAASTLAAGHNNSALVVGRPAMSRGLLRRRRRVRPRSGRDVVATVPGGRHAAQVIDT